MEDDVSKSGDKVNIGVSHKDSITFEILHVLKDAQGQHGLKHGDYQRYRGYCSRRLARIRKSLHYVQSSGGKRSNFQAKRVTNQMVFDATKNKKDPIRFLCIALMEAERAWAYAMQLKQEANTEQRKKFHLIRRMKKAVSSAQVLEALCNESPTRCDARTKLESQAYSAYFRGLFYFETEQWQKASDLLKKAETIYMKLFEAIGDEEVAVHYKQRCDEIKPTLRYCAFNIGESELGTTDLIDKLKNEASQVEDQVLATKLDHLILQTREKQAVTLSEIQWLGKTLTVKQEKIRAFLLMYEDIKSVESAKISQLEKLLFECRDCLQLLRETNQEKTSLFMYLTYLRLHLTCRRNLQLIKSLKNPIDLIRPYEIIIGCLNEMQSLTLEQHFNNDHLIEKFRKEIDAQIIVYKSFRCYHIGIAAKRNWKDSVAILHRCTQYCKLAMDNQFTPKELKDNVKHILNKAEGEKYAVYANNLMKQEEDKPEVTTKNLPPLINRLDEYHEDNGLVSGSSNLIQFPPDFKPIPCKPLFFDLALNHITFPSLEEEKANPKASGITGFVKGWLGWRK